MEEKATILFSDKLRDLSGALCGMEVFTRITEHACYKTTEELYDCVKTDADVNMYTFTFLLHSSTSSVVPR